MADVIVVNLAPGFGGGERQTILLCQALGAEGFPYVLAARKDSPLSETASREGIYVHETPSGALKSAFYLAGMAGRYGARLFHANDGKSHSACAIASLMTGLPFVLTRRVSFRRFNPFTRLKRSMASHIVCISPSVARITRVEGTRRRDISIIPDAVDLSCFSKRSRSERDKLVVSVGALTPNKRQSEAVAAFSRLDRKFSEYRLVIIGEGPCRQELQELVKKLDLADRVSLPGEIFPASPYLEKAAAFVFSSMCEGFGSSIIESLASGTPAAAYRVDGVSDALSKGGGILVPDGDTDALACAVGSVLSDFEGKDGRWDDLSNHARNAAEKYFSHRLMGRRYITLYRRFM